MIDQLEFDTVEIDEPERNAGMFDQLAALFVSMLIHVALFLALALVVFSEANPLANIVRMAGKMSDADVSSDLVTFELPSESEAESLKAETEFSLVEVEPQLDVEFDVNDLPEQPLPEKQIQSEIADRLADLSRDAAMSKPEKTRKRKRSFSEMMLTVSSDGNSYNGPLLKKPEEGVRQTRDTAGAANGILDQLRDASRHEGPRWILWVMDSSISLVNERQQLAPLVRNFYEDLKGDKHPGAFPWPTTAVFAFGQGVVPLGMNKGMPKPDEIANTLINVPIDESGIENVMNAVATAVSSVPFRNRNTKIDVVVWTDESGDDITDLENLILLCQQKNTRVHVVGPLSVFGMQKGLQQYTLPLPYNQPILLPVDRGPDSAFPERAQLPYWYESTDIDWGNGPIIPADVGKNNFGGPHRQRLLAPSGPYALTRLALATGGTFTAINRPGDIATTTRDELFDYMPDYRSYIEIASDIDQYPLRRAVIEAAALTSTANYWPPRMGFPTQRSTVFPYRSVGWYQSPQRFAKQLPDDLGESVQRLRRAQYVIEQAIQTMMLRFQSSGMVETDLTDEELDVALNEITLDQVTPSEYYQEQSPRWKAWYDLNLGRLLAHSVRIHEYILQCEILASQKARTMMLSQGYNQVHLAPSQDLKGGMISDTRVKTAVKLLQRVVSDHPDTPWADLATWELEHPAGIRPILSIRPEPRPAKIIRPRMPPPPAPKIPRL